MDLKLNVIHELEEPPRKVAKLILLDEPTTNLSPMTSLVMNFEDTVGISTPTTHKSGKRRFDLAQF